jgi:hypothetical protein
MGWVQPETPFTSASRTRSGTDCLLNTVRPAESISTQYPTSDAMAKIGECVVCISCILERESEPQAQNSCASLVSRSLCKPDSGSSTPQTVACFHPKNFE